MRVVLPTARTSHPEDLRRTIEALVNALENTLNGTDVVELRVRHTEPERPRDGMIVFADGTNWDPGSGRGLYVYDSGWSLV